MPELPEVETLRRQLNSALPGRTITEVRFSPDLPRLLRHIDEHEFISAVEGREIEAVGRRAKWLILELAEGLKLVAHLRMTGRWFLRNREDPADPYLRASICLDDGRELRWCDVRKFGTWNLVHDFGEVTGAVGPEPLEETFTSAEILAGASGRRAPIQGLPARSATGSGAWQHLCRRSLVGGRDSSVAAGREHNRGRSGTIAQFDRSRPRRFDRERRIVDARLPRHCGAGGSLPGALACVQADGHSLSSLRR